MAETVQGWSTKPGIGRPGVSVDVELIREGDMWIVYMRQAFRSDDRGKAEIIAGVLRSEMETSGKHEWRGWGPSEIAARGYTE